MSARNLVVFFALLSPGIAWADADNPSVKVKETPPLAASKEGAPTVTAKRQKVMREMDRNLEALGSLMLDPGADAADFKKKLNEHSNAIKSIARQIPELFPQDSANGTTRARSEIWEERETFQERARALNESLAAFSEAAEELDGDRLRSVFKTIDLRSVCNACHERFRN